MDNDLLRTFIQVYRLRHFGRAASTLHVTQAAVSARIKLLEDQVGVKLFDRSRREVRPTPEGHRFLHHADAILAEWQKAMYSLADDGKEIPQLTLAGSLRLWNIFLQTGWLHILRQIRPDLAIKALTGAPDTLISYLFEGVVDVVVMLEPPNLELMTTVELTYIDLFLVSTKPAQTPAVVMDKNYVMVDWGQPFEIEHRQHFPQARQPMTTVSNSGMALEYLLALGGSAYIPARVVQPLLDSGALHLVESAPTFRRKVFGVYLTKNYRADLINEALAVIGSAP